MKRKTIRDYRIDAAEASAEAYRYSSHPGARYYYDQASFACRCCLTARTPAQAKRYAERAQTMAARAKLMAGPVQRKPWHQVQQEAQELHR